jgi:hypothetical protein
MSIHEGLSVKQEAFLAALLVEPTVNKAAALARISEATATRYRADPTFNAVYHQARQEQRDHGFAKLSAHLDRAIETLVRNLDCGEPAVECRAAVAIIRQTLPEKVELAKPGGGGDLKITEIVVQLPQWERQGSGVGGQGSASPEPDTSSAPGLGALAEAEPLANYREVPNPNGGLTVVLDEPGWRVNE